MPTVPSTLRETSAVINCEGMRQWSIRSARSEHSRNANDKGQGRNAAGSWMERRSLPVLWKTGIREFRCFELGRARPCGNALALIHALTESSIEGVLEICCILHICPTGYIDRR
jgi:hypothetical protein